MKTTTILDLKISDSYLITSQENIRYLCGFSGDSSQLLITPKECCFFTDFRYETQAKEETSDCKVIITNGKNRNEEISKHIFGANLGVEKDNLSVNMFEELKIVYNNVVKYTDISGELLKLREIKSKSELIYIKKAAKASEDALENTLSYIKEGISELELKAHLIYNVNKQGMENAFEPIVAFGSNGAKPHAKTSSKKLKKGELITIDFGCKYKGYCADITRTFAFSSIDEKQKYIYNVVKNAQKTALNKAEINEKLANVDKSARDYITQEGLGEYFGHSTGHGVGLYIHELPVVSANATQTIKENMVFTIEPGVYIENEFGVRIEDMVISQTGSLYTFSKELIIL